MTRVSQNNYHTNASPQPAYEWLHGGGERQYPTAMHGSWQTVGAYQYSGSPLEIDQPTGEQTIATHHAIDTTTGSDPVMIVVPTTERGKAVVDTAPILFDNRSSCHSQLSTE